MSTESEAIYQALDAYAALAVETVDRACKTGGRHAAVEAAPVASWLLAYQRWQEQEPDPLVRVQVVEDHE